MELPSDNRITSTKSPQFYKMNLSTSLTNLTVVLPQLRVFDNWVLRRIFGPNRDEVTGEWRKLHNEELNDQYSSQNIIRVIKSSRMRWAGHVAGMGRGDVHAEFWWRIWNERYHLEDPGVDGRIII
jgi:hypothetical protein